ncbi:MAG: PAAR domain-containing protein [Roseibium sp.]|uniref:PAAR domain-containing protein n=1 Tax=Roseibium sp. TaxID=1936156 RepID=UPI001B00FB59|nr:PAAR domain-containing protein [Roseibium sp.]MBO6891409.1 PAAR domain-containing protein [Roseibium sp.]MBO6929249.1 PAAR domain-containing protein [Roseibium sp.]
MSQPSARLGDFHMCSMTPVPPGLPIAPPCKINVLIGKRPAARMTDLCICAGPPPANVDPIVKGSFTVLIGMLPAARIGDPTLKGGVITTGEFTVLIGG